MPSAKPQQRFEQQRAAFTLVELLVVMAIIGILVAILLPAIQASREAARSTQCRDNLKQMAIAFWNHEQSHGHLPTGGWGYKWIGEPDAGYGSDQPGGWPYNILAYIEQENLRNLGRGGVDRFTDPLNAERQAAFLKLLSTPLPLFTCPTKRPNQLWPFAVDPLNPFLAANAFTCSSSNGCFVPRGDYRVNAGSKAASDQPGPALVQPPGMYSWKYAVAGTQNGICYQRSTVRVSQIVDGTAKTLLIGEKYLDSDRYFDGADTADDQCLYTGHDRDNAGYTADGSEAMMPRRDTPRLKLSFYFGGPHASGFNVVLCDGSAHQLGYDIGEDVWRQLGGRSDAEG